MIPISIVIRFIQEWGLLSDISSILNPIMKIVDLPAEMALVWLTAMVVSIYGGFLAFFSIYPLLQEPLTVSQLTTLLTMILIAHTFPIELTISHKTGVKSWLMFLIRFVFAILLGFLMSKTYFLLDFLQEPAKISSVFVSTPLTWTAWILDQLKNYLIITFVIFLLVVFIRVLQVSGFIRIVNKLMAPALSWLGIGRSMLPLTVVGLSLGIAYGGGLLIEEGKQEGLKPKEIFYSMTLMGLFHSIFEDTLLMLSMGGHWSGVILFRTIFAFIITYLIVYFTKHIDEKYFLKYCMTKSYARRYLNKENKQSETT